MPEDLDGSIPASELTLPTTEKDDPDLVKERGLQDNSLEPSIQPEIAKEENDVEKSDIEVDDNGVFYPGLWKATVIVLSL